MKIDKRIEKVLLIMPPAAIAAEYTKEIQPPLGLAYIAACLEKTYQVRILDAACEGWAQEKKGPGNLITYGLPFENIKETIEDFKPDVVGVSCLYSMQHKNAHKVCEIAKTVNKNILTIMGGAHPTSLPEKTLEDKNVDIVILGEGDFSTKELLDTADKGENISHIDGIAFREAEKIKVNPKTTFINDLDSIPFPARHLLPMQKYFSINMPHGVSSRFSPNTPLITSRGCPANCIFCSIHSIWGYKYRARSVENIIQELKSLKDTYGICEIQFEDDNLTFDKKRAGRLFDLMIEEKLGISWTTPNGVAMWSLDKELLLKMKQSGCYRLCLAIESGDQKMLYETIKKPLDLNKVKELVRWINLYRFETDAFFVVGFPNETKEQLENTFKFAHRLKVDNVSFYIATPYPGTELLDICQKNGYLPKDHSLSDLGIKKATINTAHFTPLELEKMVAWNTLKYKLNLIWHNPIAFYRKVIKRFFKTPLYFLILTRKMLRKAFGI
ncbi:MAG: B12-binding domain-containing radical SAM protein [Candidatus Omnitrophica bacterium]|nr:B12-binding domain-containing radical SAM protein [Candidatus Omnitrophota bacterium]